MKKLSITNLTDEELKSLKIIKRVNNQKTFAGAARIAIREYARILFYTNQKQKK